MSSVLPGSFNRQSRRRCRRKATKRFTVSFRARSRKLETPPAGPRCTKDSSATLVTAEVRSEEHTSELQSRLHLVCRLLLEEKKRRGGASGPPLVAVPGATIRHAPSTARNSSQRRLRVNSTYPTHRRSSNPADTSISLSARA